MHTTESAAGAWLLPETQVGVGLLRMHTGLRRGSTLSTLRPG